MGIALWIYISLKEFNFRYQKVVSYCTAISQKKSDLGFLELTNNGTPILHECTNKGLGPEV